MSMSCGISELWCEYFKYTDYRKERLILMKPIAEINRGLDIVIYNSQAKEFKLELIV